jgi:hypothetical protein
MILTYTNTAAAHVCDAVLTNFMNRSAYVAAKVEDMRQKLACQTQKFFSNNSSSSNSSTTTANVSSSGTSSRGSDLDNKVRTKHSVAVCVGVSAVSAHMLALECSTMLLCVSTT